MWAKGGRYCREAGSNACMEPGLAWRVVNLNYRTCTRSDVQFVFVIANLLLLLLCC